MRTFPCRQQASYLLALIILNRDKSARLAMESAVAEALNITVGFPVGIPRLILNITDKPAAADVVANASERTDVLVVTQLRIWGYMALENIRPVYADDDISVGKFTVPLYGCVMLVLAILTLISNCTVCSVLLQPGMRGPAGSLLTAIAMSEIGMALWPIPPYFYLFTLGNYRDWLPFGWCYVSLWLLEFLPTIFHACSIWLTVAIAGQRYIAICHPLKAQRWCISNTLGAVQVAVVIFLLAIGTHLSRFFESEFHPISLPSRIHEGVSVIGCSSIYVPFVNTFTDVYFNVYFWFKTLFIHLVPCVIVSVLTTFLLHALVVGRVWKKKSSALSRESRITRHWIQLSEVKYGTCMIVVFLMVFLIIELPLTIFYSLELLQNRMLFEFDLIGSDTVMTGILFGNMGAVVFGPVKILIYFAMSKRFRKKLKFICTAVSRIKCGKTELPAW